MANFSFDITSGYDKAEMNNVYDQTKREITNRYDFKNTPASVEWLSADKNGLIISGNSQYQLDAIVDIFRKKLATRNQSQKVLDLSKEPTENNLQMRWEVPFLSGLDQEKAKKITKLLKEKQPKLKTQIQGDELRVTSNSKDDLQMAMRNITEADFDFPIDFTNFH
jgi:cyclic-di-GMP-binding protein